MTDNLQIPGTPIRVENLWKRFGDFEAVKDVNFTVEAGSITALLGPSGSGKSTVLRMIAGLEEPSAGRIWMEGEEHTFKTVQERRVGFVFQHYALFRHMNVAQNVAFGLSVRKLPRAEQRSRVQELLELVQLTGFRDRYPDQLSGGQRQRVALARALAPRPKVLLLDEPFGALDARVRQELRRWLDDLHRELGVTSLLVTHDQDEALELANQVVVMHEGRVEQAGPPDEIYNAPATPFVAGFVGTTNLVEGAAATRLFGAPGTWSIRPERVHVAAADQALAADQRSAEGVVQEVIYLGSALRLIVDVGSGTTLIATQPTLATAQSDLDGWLGRPVRLVWAAGHARNVEAA
jgi:putative spermidine/putrescine transport system ATP-binding protein